MNDQSNEPLLHIVDVMWSLMFVVFVFLLYSAGLRIKNPALTDSEIESRMFGRCGRVSCD